MPNTTNEKILTDANAAIQRGDIEGFLRHCTENTTWTFVGERTLRGKEEVRRWMVEAYKEPPVFQVDRMLSGDDHVVALGQITIKNAEGKLVRHSYADAWLLRDGALAELRAFVISAPDGTVA